MVAEQQLQGMFARRQIFQAGLGLSTTEMQMITIRWNFFIQRRRGRSVSSNT
jgi:hypothetical protein